MLGKKANEGNQLRSVVSDVLSVCAVIVLIVSAIFLIKGISYRVRSGHTATHLRKLFTNSAYAVEPLLAQKPSPNADLVVVDEPEYEFQDQFLNLYNINHDLIGWIHANDVIDYPIVWRAEDNDYYLNRDFYGKKSKSGWIFLDKRNANDMNDDHLVIYGHNMRLGDMFGELDLYRDLEYVSEHPIIEIQPAWEPQPRKYVLISLFDASMDKSHDTYFKITNFNFETPEAKSDYIAAISQRSIFELPCNTTADDQLVTLVTCSYSYPNGRFLVCAREFRADETEEHIMEQFAQLKLGRDEG